MGMPEPITLNQTHFQIRSGDTEGIDSDTGWEENEDVDATIGRGHYFRIRFKVTDETIGDISFNVKPQFNYKANGWQDATALTSSGSHPVVLIRSSNIYLDGATISTELLTNDGGTFINGEGQGDSATTTGYVLTGRVSRFLR
jgi:hypothetical protein